MNLSLNCSLNIYNESDTVLGAKDTMSWIDKAADIQVMETDRKQGNKNILVTGICQEDDKKMGVGDSDEIMWLRGKGNSVFP